jgi:hypothetical protein
LSAFSRKILDCFMMSFPVGRIRMSERPDYNEVPMKDR